MATGSIGLVRRRAGSLRFTVLCEFKYHAILLRPSNPSLNPRYPKQPARLKMGRYERLRRIERLDPKCDHAEIYHLMCGYEFPWDLTRALEVALYRTYCVPSISALLDKTGEFYRHTQRRYDDTALLVAEMSKWGYDSERGRAALRRMNRAHSRFDISNGDYLYVSLDLHL
jgi:hypothetical protein